MLLEVQPATPPRAVSAAFCAPDGCSRAICPSGAFLYGHCTHIGNSAGGAIAASPPEDTAELHPPEDLFFCPFASPNTFFRFFIQYKRAINGGFSRHASPGVPSRLHNFGMAPGGSAAGEVPAYTQPQSLRKDDAEVIAEREQGSRYGVSVPFRVTGPTTAVAVPAA